MRWTTCRCKSGGGEYTQPVVRLVNALLADAVKRGASDIHLEPEAAFLRIRYRIDGVLEQTRSLHRKYWTAISVRLKIIAGLNIAESRAPQDGRLSLTPYGRPIDFRVSVLPTLHGEKIVLRALERYRGRLPVMELLRVDDAIDAAIARNATVRELGDLAAAHGLRTLAADGLRRVRAGETTLAEVARLVDLTRRLG